MRLQADAQADQHEGPPRHRTTRRHLHWSTDTISTAAAQQMGKPVQNRTRRHTRRGDLEISRSPVVRHELMAALPELRGKDLACWCSPEPCHGEVLLELANS